MVCTINSDLHSSPLVPNSKRREIDSRLAVGGILSRLSYGGMSRLLGALNLPPPIEEKRFNETQEFMLNYITNVQQKSHDERC